MQKLSVVTITKNEEKYIEAFLKNILWADEIVVVDNGSTDGTVEIARRYASKVFSNSESNLGSLKQFSLSHATQEWIFMLDVDELVSEVLRHEVRDVLKGKSGYEAYAVPYQNYFLRHEMSTKLLVYSKIRLFKNGKGSVAADPVHEEMIIRGKVGNLKGKILHYSFRSIPQTISKFTRYARIEGKMFFEKGERVTLKKLTMYPLHMFYSIFIKDQGWRDGIWGLGLALCFTYYEFAKYWFLLRNQMRS